jgi:uncharacterized protein YjbJ (UPF0337 family)
MKVQAGCRHLKPGILKILSNLYLKEANMNWDQIAGNWKQAKGKIREKWGKLTDDDLDVIAGKRDQLIGKVQEKYGIAKEEAEKEVKKWESSAK